MQSIHEELTTRLRAAIASAGFSGDPLVMESQNPEFGDYQANGAMGIGKAFRRNPREVAQAIVAELDMTGVSEPPTVAGPGFINFRLEPSYLARVLEEVPCGSEPGASRLGLPLAHEPETVVVDLSSPNLAKEMHVGHLRSTVIGDAVARILEFQGHDVIRENHVGDWGTQFGMLVAYLRETRPDALRDTLGIRDLEEFYVKAKGRFDEDERFQEVSQQTVVALQQGDEETRRLWQNFCRESLRHCHAVYARLGIENLIDRGESFYNELMPIALDRLTRSGHAVESDGALVVYLEGYKTREGEDLPLIVRKRDGGYNYATSDLATILHRIEELGARRIVYVVGAPQKQHLEMVFAAARKAGLAPPPVRLEHLAFGSMLAANGKPFKTREGGTVKLGTLLDEAVEKARRVIEEGPSGDATESGSRRQLSAEEADAVAESVGIAAVKYFDLSHALETDYRFDPEIMLSLDGNTAPYMLYAYARIRSIGRKAGVRLETLLRATLHLEHPAEIALAKALLRFRDIVDRLGRDPRPNLLTEYLYDLSKTFSRFYDRNLGVRVVEAETPLARASRLRLCELTSRVLAIGLSLLGIRTVEQM
jgi:arginyl-tRNA synthetase